MFNSIGLHSPDKSHHGVKFSNIQTVLNKPKMVISGGGDKEITNTGQREEIIVAGNTARLFQFTLL